MNKNILLIIVLLFSLNSLSVFSQDVQIDSITIDMDTIDVSNTILLFENYKPFGMHCANKNGTPKHCRVEQRVLDNNIEDFLEQQTNTLTYLNIQYEIIDDEKLQKEIYKDSTLYRYFIKSTPIISKGGNSCFSYSGALIFEYTLEDRVLKTSQEITLDYSMFICDLQLLVNDINKSIKKSTKNK